MDKKFDTAFIVTWHVPFAGREQRALDYGIEVAEYWGKFAADGYCTFPEYFFLPSGRAMWMVKGDSHWFADVLATTKSTELLLKGALLLEDFGYELADTGVRADAYMTEYAHVAELVGVL